MLFGLDLVLVWVFGLFTVVGLYLLIVLYIMLLFIVALCLGYLNWCLRVVCLFGSGVSGFGVVLLGCLLWYLLV